MKSIVKNKPCQRRFYGVLLKESDKLCKSRWLAFGIQPGFQLDPRATTSLDPAVPEIQRCPGLANRPRVWGALPLTPPGLPVHVWIGSTRSQGIAVNLQKNFFLIIEEFKRNWIMKSKCRVRAGEGTREKGDTALWLVLTPGWPHTCMASSRLTPCWEGYCELGQKSWITFWLMGSHWS